MLLAVATCAHAARPNPTYPAGFSERVMVGGLQAPTAVAWTPDGRMLVTEKGGSLKVAAPGSSSATEILDISSRVNHAGDRGLLGLAVDKDFASNRYIYLLYTYDVDPLIADDGDTKTVSRLERFTLSPTNQVSLSKVLLGSYVSGACPQARNDLDCIPSDDVSHSIGTVRSDPRDGTLWVGSGDAASFGGTDTLALRTYDEKSMAGKIMHVDREGNGLAQHSFCPAETNLSLVCTKLYAKGFRNPYRFSLRPNGAGLMVGDVGWNQREEVDLIRQGGKSFGWPCYEGSQHTSGYRDWLECQAEYAKEGTAQAHTPPQYEYLHEEGRTVIGGPTYPGGNYPKEYDGSIFYGDYGNQKIGRLTVDGQDNVTDHHDFAANWQGMVGLEMAPSGNVAMVDIGTFDNDGAIRELVYQSRIPTARATASPTSGPVPMRAEFDGTPSTDPDGDALTYSWDFGDGTAGSTAAKPSHVYTQAGTVTARLTVNDGHGNTDTTTITLRPGNDAPTATIEAPAAESTYRDGQTITLRGSGADPQDGALAGAALRWQVLLHHDTHLHVAHEAAGAAATSFTAARDHDADSYYEVRLTARDSSGLEGTRTIFLRPETVQLNVASTPTGAPVSYGGRDFTAPLSTPTTIGFQTSLSAGESFMSGGRSFYFDRWSDGGTRERTSYTVPASDVGMRAFYVEDKAEGQPTSASSVQDSEPSFSADNAVDRDDGTRWSSSRADNQYWQVDLGRVRHVDRVRLNWEGAYASRYRILTSTDGNTWTTAADEAITAPGVKLTQFAARQARYVRVLGLQRATEYGISFWDARVMGPDDDATAAETTINSGPSGNWGSKAATFTFSSGAGASFECRMDAATWASCASPQSYSGLAEGQHTFEARATGTNGVPGPTPASRTFTVDSVAPETTIGLGPAEGGTSANRSPSFSFSSELGATFECSVDSGAYAACTSTWALAALGDGQHTFRVRAKDATGNTDATPASRTFTVDTTPPETTISAGAPTGTINVADVSFGFTSEAGATFQCRIDGGGWGACTSPKNYFGLAQGSHVFEVRAADAAGNTDTTPAQRTFTVDTVAPDTSITDGPAGTIKTTSTAFQFSATENPATFECKLDSGSWAGCGSPRGVNNLSQGSHTYYVRARDAAGNTDASPASRAFTVDTVSPETTITVGPPTGSAILTSDTSFGFTSELGATFECKLDAGAWTTCTSPQGYSGLSQGSHTFQVRATDTAGNVDATPDQRTFTVDSTAPETTLASGGPSGPSAVASASFTFSSEAGASFECRLDGGTWGGCSSPKTYSGLSQGSHTFEVRAKDGAGNYDPSPASRTWTVDTVAPDTSIDSGPSGVHGSRSAQYAFSSPEGGVTFECKLDGGAWEPCSSPKSLSGLADGGHTFQVRAKDTAGNLDATPASRSITVDTAVPATAITQGPTGTITSTSASVSFSGTGAARYECKLDSGGWDGCSSPRALSSLSQGSHTFSVRGISGSGIVESDPPTRTFTVDTVAPGASIDSGPSGTITTASTAFGFTSEAGATFDCRLDGGSWQACSSPKDVSGLADGTHTFSVRAKDSAGNQGAEASRGFTVDTSPPATTPPDTGTPPTAGSQTPSETGPAPTKTPKPTYASTVMATRGLEAMFGLGDAGRGAVDAKGGRAGRFRGSPKRAKPLARSGRDDLARAFDGRDDRIDLDPRSLGSPRAFAIETWVKAGRRGGTILSLNKRPLADGVELEVDARRRVNLTVFGEVSSTLEGPGLGSGRHHVVATYDRRRARIYVDGKLRSSTRFRFGMDWSRKQRATIGGGSDGKNLFQGTLDELAFYDRALTAATVKAHFSAGR